MSLSDVFTADRRLVILRLLEQAPGYAANDSILHSGLEHVGHRCSRDQVRTDLAWLAEQGLVEVEMLPGAKIVVATIVARGLDVANGRATVPGVKRPSPR
jgi:Fe2+ or Zn2+ uptake regulation protein